MTTITQATAMENTTPTSVLYKCKEGFDKFIKSSNLQPYTWVYRWNNDDEFKWDEMPNIHKPRETIKYTDSPQA